MLFRFLLCPVGLSVLFRVASSIQMSNLFANDAIKSVNVSKQTTVRNNVTGQTGEREMKIGILFIYEPISNSL
jgi:hypothetical protein